MAAPKVRRAILGLRDPDPCRPGTARTINAFQGTILVATRALVGTTLTRPADYRSGRPKFPRFPDVHSSSDRTLRLAMRPALTSTTALCVTFLGLLVTGCFGEETYQVGSSSRQSVLSFAPDNVWTTPLDDGAPLDPDSHALASTLISSVTTQTAEGRGPALSARARTPLYVADTDVEEVPVALDSGPWADELERELAKGVPVPPGAQPSRGSDGMMTIWQPSKDRYWEFFLMQQALHAPQVLGTPVVSPYGRLGRGTYRYALTALNQRGETESSNSALARVGLGGGAVTIRWSDVDGAGYYRIYRSTAGAGVGLVATVPGNHTSFADDGERQSTGETPPSRGSARTPGQWHAAYGGMIPNVSRNPGYYVDARHPGGGYRERFYWGASSSSLPLVPGLVTRRDVRRGRIDHALSIGLPNLTPSTSIIAAGRWAFPAQRSDGKSTLPDAIPEGARLRLDPDLDLDAIPLTPFTRMLAEAAKRYGMIVHGGSEATVVYGEDPSPYERAGKGNFYQRYPEALTLTGLAAFPWEHLEVLRLRVCSDPGEPCTEGAPPEP
jgi:hypothetical protein